MANLMMMNLTTSFACTFHHHRSTLPAIHGKRSQPHPAVSCRSHGHEHDKPARSLDRRDLLLGLGGLYGASTTLGADRAALGNPIQAPDLTKCVPAAVHPDAAHSNKCCPPTPSTDPIDFKPPPPPSTLRCRPAAHLVDEEYLAKYKEAVKRMKELPADDPRNFNQQAKVHCAYCDGGYEQVGFPKVNLQVHFSWLFFPFHRYYLYFYERILGKLIGDDTFALPFWNWDNPAGMTLPTIFTDPTSPLYDELRSAKHQPPALIDLDYGDVDHSNLLTEEQLIVHNLTIMYRQMVTNASKVELFMGKPYRAGDKSNPGMGSLEGTPHNNVHAWTGRDKTQTNGLDRGEDMGILYSAAWDPVFYAHHSNVDRMWNVWRGLGGRNFGDKDWLDATFLFYDEEAQPVKVKVKDCLDDWRLGYTYQHVQIPWLRSRPTPAKKGAEKPEITEATFPVTLEEAVSASVKRPRASRRSRGEKAEEVEVLVVEGIELAHDVRVKFDVYVNAPEYEGVGPGASEFAGSFVHVPHRRAQHGGIETTLSLGITELLEDLDAEGDDSVVVTLVPVVGKGKVSIGGLRIEFAS